MASSRGMYWYKPWRELRARILLGIVGFAVICVLGVWMEPSFRRPPHWSPYATYLWKLLYTSVLRDLFIVLTIVLASGSLVQERPQGTLGFSLALPVSRRYASVVRAAVGYLGMVAMALVPALVLSLVSAFVGQHYPLSVGLRLALLYACGGGVVYGLTFLLAHLMEGEYSAFLLALPIIISYDLLLDLPGLNRIPSLDFIAVMTGVGMPWFDMNSGMFRGGMPWIAMGVMVAVAAAFIWLAINRVAERDFA